MKDQEEVEQLRDLMESAGVDVREYSGRGMFGEECLGFASDQEMRDIAELIDATQGDLELTELLADALRNARTDSLGRGMIVYFPSYRITEEEDDR